jgi:hypothetical protein
MVMNKVMNENITQAMSQGKMHPKICIQDFPRITPPFVSYPLHISLLLYCVLGAKGKHFIIPYW